MLQVEVANPNDKKVTFGALRVGQTSQRVVKLVNRSPAPITFTVAITPAVMALQQANVLTVAPTTELSLRPHGGTCSVEFTFRPKTRIPQFTEEVSTFCFVCMCMRFKLLQSEIHKNISCQRFRFAIEFQSDDVTKMIFLKLWVLFNCSEQPI